MQITDGGGVPPPYNVGDTYTISVTGSPGQAVTLSLNGGSQTSVGTIPSSGTLVVISGTWGLADVGDYTETYYVAGVMAVPGLVFQVGNAGSTFTCGRISPINLSVANTSANPSTNIAISVPVVFPQGTNPADEIVSFQVAGPNFGGSGGQYFNSFAATPPQPGSRAWTYALNSGGLLGIYSVTPKIGTVSGLDAACTTATQSVGFIAVTSGSLGTPGPANCASFTGTWTSTPTAGSGWATSTLSVTDSDGTLSGTASYVGACNTPVSFSGLTGSYTASNQNYTLTATGGTVTGSNRTEYTCGNRNYGTVDFTVAGALNGAPMASSCGLGTGNQDTSPGDPGDIVGDGMKIERERIPASETSAAASPAWGDAIGFQATAIFNMTLSAAANSPAYNFGGRRVQEQDPTPAQTPAGYAGSDGCIFNGGPWTNAITSLAATDIWYVQSATATAPNGSYGPDYIGLGPTWVALTQAYSPKLRAAGSSCTIQYPQLMEINHESVAYDPNNQVCPDCETYGGNGTGINLIQFVITPTSFTVNRGTATDPRTYHF